MHIIHAVDDLQGWSEGLQQVALAGEEAKAKRSVELQFNAPSSAGTVSGLHRATPRCRGFCRVPEIP